LKPFCGYVSGEGGRKKWEMMLEKIGREMGMMKADRILILRRPVE